ncbi:MAG TPA: hypothetical protein VGO50_16595 [Pyrinomonadaceae bacterium]|jgi:hypothetical protein|nr:hypothetical protein [Pyrinomonadaceae bacterium]
MHFTVLPSPLHTLAEAANLVIKTRYGLADGIVEQQITPEIPLQPTLHWKTKTHFIACEVAERPLPVSVKVQFADIVQTGQPIRIIVAYPKNNDLSLTEYQNDIKSSKNLGIGYLGIDEEYHGEIEYPGVSLALRIDTIDTKIFKPSLKPLVTDAYEHYMKDGNPAVGLQKLGQVVESIILNVAKQAKKKGVFTSARFQPPKHLPQSHLIDDLIAEDIIDIPILGSCRTFANDRNSVSHAPKSRKEAIELERKIRDSFSIGKRILEDLPAKIKERGYKLQL